MCNHCYHKYGRTSYADACPHTERLAYAKGKCQNCYLNDYNKERRRLKKARVGKHVVESNNTLNNRVVLDSLSKRFKYTIEWVEVARVCKWLVYKFLIF